MRYNQLRPPLPMANVIGVARMFLLVLLSWSAALAIIGFARSAVERVIFPQRKKWLLSHFLDVSDNDQDPAVFFDCDSFFS